MINEIASHTAARYDVLKGEDVGTSNSACAGSFAQHSMQVSGQTAKQLIATEHCRSIRA
jgi:hypothetical protein